MEMQTAQQRLRSPEKANVLEHLRYFLQDLRKFKDAEERLTVDLLNPFVLSSLYLPEEEVSWVLTLTGADGKSLAERIMQIQQKQRGICTSHALFPVFQEVLGITTQELEGSSFRRRYQAFTKQAQAKLHGQLHPPRQPQAKQKIAARQSAERNRESDRHERELGVAAFTDCI